MCKVLSLTVQNIQKSIQDIEISTGKIIQENKTLSGTYRLWITEVIPDKYFLAVLSDYIAINL